MVLNNILNVLQAIRKKGKCAMFTDSLALYCYKLTGLVASANKVENIITRG